MSKRWCTKPGESHIGHVEPSWFAQELKVKWGRELHCVLGDGYVVCHHRMVCDRCGQEIRRTLGDDCPEVGAAARMTQNQGGSK